MIKGEKMMTKRRYLALIQQSVNKDDISFEEIATDYLYRAHLKQDLKSFIMHDVEIGLNNASAAKVAMSKSATYATLKREKIPAIEHVFIMNSNSRFISGDSFQLARELFYQWGETVVLKQDNGSQGNNVYKISDIVELNKQLQSIFSLQANASISPYYEAIFEYRIVTLLGEPKLLLAKERTRSWKHNLISGALSKDVEPTKIPQLSEIASKVAKAMELDFCSIDILETTSGLRVLEVNEQVMLDEYCKNNENREEKVAQLYREAFLERFKRI